MRRNGALDPIIKTLLHFELQKKPVLQCVERSCLLHPPSSQEEEGSCSGVACSELCNQRLSQSNTALNYTAWRSSGPCLQTLEVGRDTQLVGMTLSTKPVFEEGYCTGRKH
ncbi:unnamed protein product [Caretta caretta]